MPVLLVCGRRRLGACRTSACASRARFGPGSRRPRRGWDRLPRRGGLVARACYMRIGRLDKVEGRDVSSPHAAGASRTGERGLASHRGSRSSQRRLIMRRIPSRFWPSLLGPSLLAPSLLAVALGVALVPTPPASAQAPPPWKQGQPANLADST